MDNIIFILDELKQIELPNPTYYVLVAIAVIYSMQFLSGLKSNSDRAKLASEQRDSYYRRLVDESLKVANEKLTNDLETVQRLQELTDKNVDICNQLEDEFGSDDDLTEDDIDFESSQGDDEDYVVDKMSLRSKVFKEKHSHLKDRSDQLGKINKSIKKLSSDLMLNDSSSQPTTEDLINKKNQLEAENEDLKSQIEEHTSNAKGLMQLGGKGSKLDPKLIRYLEEHREDLTLKFLTEAYETLLELKVAQPNIDFNKYVDEIKDSHGNYLKRLEDLMVKRKAAEKKLEQMRLRYNKELSSFFEIRVEHILKNSSSQDYLNLLVEKNNIYDTTIGNLTKELQAKRQDMETWKEKYHEAEQQCNFYFEAWKKTQLEREHYEAERRAQERRERALLDQHLNRSSASSMVDGYIPQNSGSSLGGPYMPLQDPMLRLSANQPSVDQYGMKFTPPSPTNMQVSFNDFFHQAKAANISSRMNDRRNTRTKIGNRYGRVVSSSTSKTNTSSQ